VRREGKKSFGPAVLEKSINCWRSKRTDQPKY